MSGCGILCGMPYKIFMYIGVNEEKVLVTKSLISKELCVPESTVRYNTARIYGEGLINYQNSPNSNQKLIKNNPIYLTQKGKKLFKYLWNNLSNSKKLRAHNIQIKFNIVCKDTDLINQISEPFTNKRYAGLKLELLGCKVMIYSKSKLVCVVPDIYADSSDEIVSSVELFIPDLVNMLSSELKVEVVSYEVANIQTMHVAVLNSILADSILLKKGVVYKGSCIDIDKSKGNAEIESTNVFTCLDQIEGIIKYEDLYRENIELKEEVKNLKEKTE